MSEKPEIFLDITKSQVISKEIVRLSAKIDAFDQAETILNNSLELIDLLEEENDESALADIENELEKVEKTISEMHLATLLGGKYDKLNALLTLHSGAGGTEACDWTEMLYRMYICYAEKNGFTITELDRLEGDGAGIKSVSFKVEGDCAYGYLKAEKGVHRLVRI